METVVQGSDSLAAAEAQGDNARLSWESIDGNKAPYQEKT